MPLLSFWESNPDAVSQLTIEQIVSNAGDGTLRDQSTCSEELRSYLGQITSEKIGTYIDHCLGTSFPKSGMVLQDLVNELGRRLDYKVTNGRYQGVANAVGYDGIWQSPEHHSLVVEVKTTDAYRISIDTPATYRTKLHEAGTISDPSSILIVVGRQETGELEAQIRGSRHAWDVRVISIEALLKLVALKENSEADATGQKIRSLLTPVEYTRLDKMIDVMFATAKDVEGAEPEEAGPSETGSVDAKDRSGGRWEFTSASDMQAKREQIVTALASRENVPLVRRTRALYWNAQKSLRVACSISKRYERNGLYAYWYAYHPSWDEFLSDGESGYLVLGCMDKDEAYAIPRGEIQKLLPFLNTTTPQTGDMYWHLHIADRTGTPELMVPKQTNNLSLRPFTVTIDAKEGEALTSPA
jgi:hypothetical protein